MRCLQICKAFGLFPDSSVGKESACNAGDLGLIHGLGRSPGEGNGNPLQYPCLENPMDSGAYSPWSRKSQTQLKTIFLSSYV